MKSLTSRIRAAAWIVIAVTFTPLLQADHYDDFYVIPVAGHTPGAHGTSWKSDLSIFNFQDASIVVDIVVIESGEGTTENVYPVGAAVVVPAHGSVRLEDVLESHRGLPATTGALLVGADRPFALGSRSYTASQEGGTYGQTVPALRDFVDDVLGDTAPAMATAYLPGVRSAENARSNLGFVAGANDLEGAMRLQITLRDAAGVAAGTRAYTIPPGQFVHLQIPVSAIGSSFADPGSLTFQITSGNGAVIPYLSVIDNLTGDATLTVGQFPKNAAAAKRISTSPFRELFRRVTGR